MTYAEQRSFLFDRVDGQARAAIAPVPDALGGRGIGPRGFAGGGGPPDGDGPRAPPDLPSGTYGQRRDAAGAVVGGGPGRLGQSSAVGPGPAPDRASPLTVEARRHPLPRLARGARRTG